MGCASNWHVSLPDTVAVITPDPHRGVGRNRGAHIRVQKEPVIWPAGAGTDYVHPEGSRHDPKGNQGTLQRGFFDH
ncbi:hypothetical protein PS624_00933 [Pseudomonas fluorescens]|jgi:hypothetical protein|uniref:Uncharacterized protein n=1 Tax=Pseudomonas fluorescens TaxID=294 RepID=A0A5E6QF90_PSEFL|nr:hypothetical protein PS624_00933 [Pseudomonas fluorescens]